MQIPIREIDHDETEANESMDEVDALARRVQGFLPQDDRWT